MTTKPRLKTYLTVFPLGDSTWGLRGGDEELWRLKLRDPRHFEALGRLLPHLDGASTRDEILERLGGNGTEPELLAGLLDQLGRSGFLEDAAAGGLDEAERRRHRDQLRFFSRFADDGGEAAQAALAEARLGVVGDSPLAAALARVLVRSGFGEVISLAGEAASGGDGESAGPRLALDREAIWPEDGGEAPAALVVAQQAHDPRLLEAVDAFSKERRVPWLLVRLLAPHEGWVGPLFIPGETPSYVSFHARLQGHRPHPEADRAFDDHLRGGAAARPSGGLHAFAEQLAGMAAVELVKLVTGFAIPHLAGRFVTVDLLTWEIETHRVLKVPRLEAESYSRPRLFPWKEIPYGDKPTRRA